MHILVVNDLHHGLTRGSGKATIGFLHVHFLFPFTNCFFHIAWRQIMGFVRGVNPPTPPASPVI
jgi:hypothetical protein